MSEKTQIIRSIYPDEDVPKNLTIPGFLRLSCKDETLEDISQVCSDTGVEYTRREVLDQAGRFANALKAGKFDLNPGDHVAILLPNFPEYLSIMLGVMEAELVAVLMNPAYTTYELEPMFQSADIRAIVSSSEDFEKIGKLAAHFKIKHVITVGDNKGNGPEYFTLIREFSPLKADPYGDGNKLACALFSSGTSGLPKAVGLSHYNWIAQLLAANGIFYRLKEKEVTYTVFPRFAVGGVFFMLYEFYRNACLVGIQTKFSPTKLARFIKKYKPTWMSLVPTVVAVIASSSELNREDFRHLTTVTYGGAVLGNVLFEKFRSKVGPEVAIHSVYGFTECAGFLSCLPVKQSKFGNYSNSVGFIMPDFEVKVVDTETGVDLGPTAKGEIWARGKSFFKGYLNNDEATYQAIDSDGWYHTGDFGHYDDRGYLYVDGRIKDLIKVHAFQVSPEEIENIVRKHDKVREVAVFGIPNEKSQEVPRAWILPEDSSLTEDDIQEFLKDKLIAYKQLRGGVKFVDNLPMNAMGKVVRREVKELDAKLSI